MSEIFCARKEDILAVLESAETGDCIMVNSLSDIAENSRELLGIAGKLAARGADICSAAEAIDTRTASGKMFFTVCGTLSELDRSDRKRRRQDGIDRARDDGKYKGRKPIAVDENLFDSVVALWQDGKITARQAMAKLDLKPNTFYRRIKEREDAKMTDMKKAGHEIREEIRDAAKQSRRDLDELKKQVRAEAKEVKKAADEKLELHDVERELRKDRIRAEIEYHDSVKQLKKEVEAEAKELRKLNEE